MKKINNKHDFSGLKKTFILALTLSISGCFSSPTVKSLVEDEELMRVIKRAVKQEVPYSNMFPMTLRLGDLVKEGFIDKQTKDKVIKLTQCVNLNGVTLNVQRGEVFSVDVSSSDCEAGIENS